MMHDHFHPFAFVSVNSFNIKIRIRVTKSKHSLWHDQTSLPNLHSSLQLKRHQNHLQQQNQYFFTLALFVCVPFGFVLRNQ
jgi:uncharacterized membrane protein SirB2